MSFGKLSVYNKLTMHTLGTLSPMLTFASELDVRFPVTLEASHVIDKRQVWVGTLSHGPSGQDCHRMRSGLLLRTFSCAGSGSNSDSSYPYLPNISIDGIRIRVQ